MKQDFKPVNDLRAPEFDHPTGRTYVRAMSGYLPIAEHALIGDLHTVALVGTDGTIDWYCCPRFDSPSVFGAILDSSRGGHWRIAPISGEITTKQLYLPDTNIVITRFLTEDGVGELQDFMPIGDSRAGHSQRLVRRVSVVRGEMRFSMELAPRFNYGRDSHTTNQLPGAVAFKSESLSLVLSSEVELSVRDGCATATFVLVQDQAASFVLEQHDAGRPLTVPGGEAVQGQLYETIAYWRGWLRRSRYSGRWREMVHRSALTLKLLTYRPTGAIVAAPTASLPESLGGERNWDYRYTWIRDAAFTSYALLKLGFDEEAAAFMAWLTRAFADTDGGSGGPLRIMYGIDGRAELPEETLEGWEGYRGSVPVRVGNAASNQLQLDIYGELIDSVYLYNKYGRPISYDGWAKVRRIVDWVCANWDQPDEGIWETRGGRRHFTYSRLMCWVAVERAVRMARQRGLPADIGRWMSVRDEIYEQIMERGWNPGRGAFVQHYDTTVVDASVLLMPLVKFIAPTDPRLLSTLDVISRELVSDSLVYRYNVEASPDGLRGDEGTFSICTFWYVEALARAGRPDDARLVLEKMFTYANHVGLYAEEIGRTGEQLGNFPQAFTHLALISAASYLDSALG